MEINITLPKEEDFNQLFELLKQLWPNLSLDKSAMKEIYLKGLTSNDQHYLIATTKEEKMIGFVSLSIKNNLWQCGNLAHIDELIVDHNYRGKGIGSLLINEIITVAINKKCKRVELDSAFHRVEAHEFYEKYGFENRAYLFSKPIS
jgi:ribosomal protein S18 acetylase RimI-like enzyme